MEQETYSLPPDESLHDGDDIDITVQTSELYLSAYSSFIPSPPWFPSSPTGSGPLMSRLPTSLSSDNSANEIPKSSSQFEFNAPSLQPPLYLQPFIQKAVEEALLQAKQAHESFQKQTLQKTIQQLREEILSETMEEMKRRERTAFEEGVKFGLKNFFRNFSGSLPPSVRHVLSVIATGEPLSRDPKRDTWKPPKYEAADQYTTTACAEWDENFWLGSSKGRLIMGTLCGFVRCHETIDNMSGELDLAEKGILEWENENVEFYVLGLVNGTGTAILLDCVGNVWLYNHPDAIDPPHENFTNFCAAICLRAGETAVKDVEIQLTNVLKNVKVSMIKDEESEEDIF